MVTGKVLLFEQQYPRPRLRQKPRGDAARRPAADDDYIEARHARFRAPPEPVRRQGAPRLMPADGVRSAAAQPTRSELAAPPPLRPARRQARTVQTGTIGWE